MKDPLLQNKMQHRGVKTWDHSEHPENTGRRG